MTQNNQAQVAPAQKEFSNAEIKRSLKTKSKGELIKIIKDLAKKIDELKAEKDV